MISCSSAGSNEKLSVSGSNSTYASLRRRPMSAPKPRISLYFVIQRRRPRRCSRCCHSGLRMLFSARFICSSFDGMDAPGRDARTRTARGELAASERVNSKSKDRRRRRAGTGTNPRNVHRDAAQRSQQQRRPAPVHAQSRTSASRRSPRRPAPRSTGPRCTSWPCRDHRDAPATPRVRSGQRRQARPALPPAPRCGGGGRQYG